MNTEPELHWIQDLARQFGVSSHTLHRLRQEGRLTAYRRPGSKRTLFDLHQVRKVLTPQPLS